MEIILNKTIHNLGKKYEIVNVNPGYARNYLIPSGLAMEHTPKSSVLLEDLRKKNALENDILKKEAQDLADRMANVNLNIEVKAGSKGKIFGSVTVDKISKTLKNQGVFIEKHNIVLSSPIKVLGKYTAKIKLHDDVECDLTFSVNALH